MPFSTQDIRVFLRLLFEKKYLILLILVAVAVGVLLLSTNNTSYTRVVPIQNTSVSSGVTSTQALEKVAALPEVQAYMARVRTAHGDPHIGVGDTPDVSEQADGKYWSVQVYENLGDHNSTFAWYSVSVTTGKVEKQGM